MKTKFLGIVISLVTLFTVTGANVCLAQTPEITREYIARNIKGVESHEENLTAFYGNMQVKEGDFINVKFLDNEDSVLDEYDIEIDIYNLSGLNFSLSPEALAGTEYIKITIYGYNSVNNGVKLPFKIY